MTAKIADAAIVPQWSPAFTAGKSTLLFPAGDGSHPLPQWSPAFTAGKSRLDVVGCMHVDVAAMEPGLHGREESPANNSYINPSVAPQWSPAFTAGKSTCPLHLAGDRLC